MREGESVKRRLLVICIMLTVLCAFPAYACAISAPVMNSAVAADDGSIDLVWKSMSSADKFYVYRATSKDGTYKKIGTAKQGSIGYQDKDVKKYKTYWYKVKAVSGSTKSKYSKPVGSYVDDGEMHNKNIKFKVAFSRGTETLNSRCNFCTDDASIVITFMYKGKVSNDFTVSCDKAAVSVKKLGSGKVKVTPKETANVVLTFKHNKDKGTLRWEVEKNSHGDATLIDSERDHSPKGAIYPERRKTVMAVKCYGNSISNFTASSSNKRIATVSKSGSKITITNKHAGICKIRIKYNGHTTSFKWVVRRGAATSPVDIVEGVSCSTKVSKSKVKAGIRKLNDCEYSKSEIASIAKNKTYKTAASKISSLQDMNNYLMARKYGTGKLRGDSIKTESDNKIWFWVYEPQVFWKSNRAHCGGTATYVNGLLGNDYDSQGYIFNSYNNDGHVFNYIKIDGLYYFIDYSNFRYGDGAKDNCKDYILYVTDSFKDFFKYYTTCVCKNWDNPSREDYLIRMIIYERDGKAMYPDGCEIGKYQDTSWGSTVSNLFPVEMKSKVKYLYVRNGFTVDYADCGEEPDRSSR